MIPVRRAIERADNDGVDCVTNQLFDLSGLVAIVTGGNAGIGLAMARGLAEAGASVVIADRNADNSAQARDALEGDGHQVLACITDVTEPASVARMVAATCERFGRIDVLVNN